MLKVGVIGATGYTGAETVKILLNHPEVELTYLASSKPEADDLSVVYPYFSQKLPLEVYRTERALQQCDAVFLALPHGVSAKVAAELYPQVKVIDLSGDLRLQSEESYREWYGEDHGAPHLLQEAVYGLSEWNKEAVSKAGLIANPGCYPTAVLLALLPLAKEGLLEEPPSISALSGISGAGKTYTGSNLFVQCNENLSAYAVGGKHRHIPEMEQMLSRVAGQEKTISFVPHLAPMDRGILVTAFIKIKDAGNVRPLYEAAYKKAPFVKVLPEGGMPHTKHVRGSNMCHIGLAEDARTGYLNVVAAIDNLVKGAGGQAVQNMNIMYGFPEEKGLPKEGLWP